MAVADTLRRAALLKKLKENQGRRGMAVVELEDSRAELAALLKQGRDLPVPVTKMCEAAGINRERAYELLRRDAPPRPAQAYNNEGSTE